MKQKENKLERKKDAGTESKNASRKKKIRMRSEQVARIVLGVVGAAAIMSVAVAAPGIFGAVRSLYRLNEASARRYRSPAYIRKVLERMERQGLVRVYERRGETVARLTPRGERELSRYTMKEKSLKSWRWDKKWRIIIFDISEKRRYARDRIRMHIEELGFVKLQNSVWVYPYECEELVSLLKADFEMGKEVLYIVAKEIEGEAFLKKRFGFRD